MRSIFIALVMACLTPAIALAGPCRPYAPIVGDPYYGNPSIVMEGIPGVTRVVSSDGIDLGNGLCGAPDTLTRLDIDVTIDHDARTSTGTLRALGDTRQVGIFNELATYDLTVIDPAKKYFIPKGSSGQSYGIRANDNGLITYRFAAPIQRTGPDLDLGVLAGRFMFVAAYGDSDLYPSSKQLQRSGLIRVPEAVEKLRGPDHYAPYAHGDDDWWYPQSDPPRKAFAVLITAALVPVPLPASALLLAAGLAGLATLRRRRPPHRDV